MVLHEVHQDLGRRFMLRRGRICYALKAFQRLRRPFVLETAFMPVDLCIRVRERDDGAVDDFFLCLHMRHQQDLDLPNKRQALRCGIGVLQIGKEQFHRIVLLLERVEDVDIIFVFLVRHEHPCDRFGSFLYLEVTLIPYSGAGQR